MRRLLTSLVLLSFITVEGVAFQAPSPQAPKTPNLSGRWGVKFKLSGIGERNLIFESQARGSGSFMLLDTGPDNKPETAPRPAVWSQTTNNRVSLSGEVELPIATCCRETGTLIFKGKFISNDSIAGKAIFVGSTTDEENFNGFRSTIGTFTATRLVN